MKKIIRIIVPIIVFAANFTIAIYACVFVADYLIDTLDLVGFWVFLDAIVSFAVACLVFYALNRVATMLHLDIDAD